ncbi:uncharacterized protein LOC106061099 isoform X3 [Biomphalaria glabrata]|uniref:Uncharacterized protein LOC106061099 isoform X3 n=1 Tax=Biomphalaria glabrata TaxID=6526 RepID=A0A9W2Z4R6_BIOGL|nr:uncharacterized protein LOC106061099 isoform X3 [Biomphalaria glabrata]
MQWINKSQFHGQVKTAGLEKSMQWKTGNVDFDYDPETDTWKVKLFFKVNPNRASHEILIKNSVSLSLKCGRLIVDDKNGDGIHIKLTSNDVASAKALISQIQKSEPIGQSHNKAEVGLTSKASILYKKGTENVSPPDHSLLLTNQQNRVAHNGEVKARTPTHGPTSTPNQALKSNRTVKTDPNQNGLCTDEEDMDLEASTTHGKFTGVKDIATRAPNLHNGPSVASGLGTKRFYGSQSTSTFDHPNKEIKNTQATSSSEDRSPKLKRAKLTDGYNSPTSSSLTGSYSQGKMPLVVPDASRGSPQEEEVTLVQAEGGDASQRTVGFDNLGNTCFMNSPLQCLSSLEPLSIDFQSAVMEYGLDLKANSITRLLYLLMKDVRKLDACPERVRQILTRLRHDINRKFALNTQQDAHELLAELLDRTDEEMKQVMRNRNMEALENASSSASNFSNMSPGTPIETNFMWFYKTSFFFHECKTEVISQHEEKDTTLMLALDSNKDSNLQDCIDRYFESSEVDMRCEKCGKEEKATMTRKIVRRPRIFIMNLLRYQTDNAESKKKMDKVAISSYTSVAEYCAEDVKAPPFMEPLFMFERMSCNPKQKSHGDLPDLIVPAVRCEMSCSTSLTIDTGSNPDSPMKEVSKQPLVKKVVLVDPKKGDGCDADVKLLVQTLIEKFWEVEKYIHEFGGDLDYLYVETRSVISEVNQFVEQMKKSVEDVEARSKTPETSDQDSGYLQENQGALCHSLINRALHDDTSANELDGFLDTHDCTLICNEILSTRYNAYTKEDKKVDHFIEDLGLYLAAKRLGIAKPDTPKKTKGQTQSASVFQDSACNTRIPREREDSQCAEAGSDEEVSFKKEVAKEKVELEDGTQLIPGFQMDTLWCETDKDKRTPKIECEPVDASSFGGTGLRQTEHQYFNPESSANLLLGKDVGLYTEAELQTIDVSSLTEDEMMLYAQALSKLEYMKENGSLANEDDMELCDMDDKPIVDPMLSGGPLLEHHSDEDWVGVDVSGCKPQCTETCTELNQQSKQLSPSHELSDKNLKLICDEDLCDFDEIDGAKGSRQKKSKNREWPEDSQHNWLELESTIPKYCDFCNEVFEGECLSCSVMNQPSMDESPPPPYESGSSSGKSSTDSKQSAPRVLSDKCNTPPDNSKKGSNSKDVSPVTSDSAKVASDLAASEKAYKQTDDNDHVVPSLPALCSSSKVDKFFSPSKPNNLTKSRDYSRLRSPSASPRKRNKVNVKSSSASKRLLFPGDDRGERSEGSSYLDDGPPFHDLSRDLDTSLEVNIGESSFDTRDESFMTPVSSYTRVGLPGTPFSPMGRQPGSSSHANSTPKGSTSAKQDSKLGNIQQMDLAHSGPAQVLQINQSQADLVKDQKDPTSCAVPQKDIGTKEKSQDLIRDKTQTLGKSKLSRYSYTSSSNTEEKENDPADQAKNVRMENIEMGKADFSYRLVGIVNHHGESLFAGHYTAFAYNLSKQKWFYMDDKHTKETSETTAKRESLHSGYVFFYMDKDLFHEYEAKVRRTSGMKT